MKRLSATVLAIGLLASGVASAQSTRYYGTTDRYGEEPHYDYARVVRVDPIIDNGYGRNDGYANTTTGQRCYYRNADDVYARDEYRDGYRNDGYPDDRYGDDGYYGDRRYPDRSAETGRTVATVIGGIVGAVLGSKVGGGSARYATSAIGSMVGGMAGREIYDQTQRDRYVRPATVRVCDPEPVRSGHGSYDDGYDNYRTGNATAYDVTYEYNGRRYTRRMDHHPGDRVRVRVDVSPQ